MSTTPPSKPDNFNAAAAAAAARILSPRSTSDEKSPAEFLAESLTLESPKIDTAVRAFLSLVAARSITATKTEVPCSSIAATSSEGPEIKCFFKKDGGKDPNMESLHCARALLRAINGLTMPDVDVVHEGGEEKEKELRDDAEWVERQVVRIVWNALVAKGHKVSKIFGRRALRYTYPVILNKVRQERGLAVGEDSILPRGIDPDCSVAFFEEFGALLTPLAERKSNGSIANDDMDDDSALLWDADGGAAELQRRRDRRVQRGRDVAAERDSRAREALSSAVGPSLTAYGEASNPGSSSVTIEEIVEEEEQGSNRSS